MSVINMSGIPTGYLNNIYNGIKKKTLLHGRRSGHVKNAAIFFSRKATAGITIEAALAFPLFMFFSLFIITFLMIIALQVNIQASLDDAARSLDRKAYMAARSDIGEMAVNAATISYTFWDDDLKSKVDRSFVKGGSGGVSLLFSTYDNETGILDIVVNYDYEIPFLPEALSNVHLSQRSKSRAWIGRSLDEAGGDLSANRENEDDDKKIVYVTETGSVYHTSKSCHYLDLSIRQADFQSIASLRNQNGAKYYGCPICAKGIKEAGTVYITDYGDNWHTSLSCSGLKRTIMEKDISDIGDMPACSKCGGKH